jgi:hypothetical protein
MQKEAEKNYFSWGTYHRMLTAKGRGDFLADFVVRYWLPSVDSMEEAEQRWECAENMHRLALAMLLYQCENGKLPDENWAGQIEKYLGKNPEQYFSCPANSSPKGETTYAMVQYGDMESGTLDRVLLMELAAPVPFDKAIISLEEAEQLAGRLVLVSRQQVGHYGMNVAYRSGAVQWMYKGEGVKELRRALGREVESD